MAEPEPPKEFRTDRLLVREQGSADIDVLYDTIVANEGYLGAFVNWAQPLPSKEKVRSDVAKNEAGWRAGSNFCWNVFLSSSNEHLGAVDFRTTDEDGMWEFGYWFARSARGHGYAHEASVTMLDHLFAIDGAEFAIAETHVENERSQRLLERLGLTKVSATPMQNGDERWSIDRATWQARRSQGKIAR